MLSVLAYMIIKLHWHDSKMPYEEYFSILKKAYHKHHSKTGEKLVIDKIIPKYFSHIELSILHACDGIMYGMNFIDLAKFTPRISLKTYCNEYLKFSTSSNYTLNTNNKEEMLRDIIISKLHGLGEDFSEFKNMFEQKEYNITFCPYAVNVEDISNSNNTNNSITLNFNTTNNTNPNNPKEETKITHLSAVELLSEYESSKLLSEKSSNSNQLKLISESKETKSNIKPNKTFEYYNKKHFTGITDERLARLFPTIQPNQTNQSSPTETKKVNIEQVKSSRSSGSYTCKELREKLNSLGISYNTRQKKKELAELLRNNLMVKHESNRESIITKK